MSESNSTPSFGFPDFWPLVYERYCSLFDATAKIRHLAEKILNAAATDAKVTKKLEIAVYLLARMTIMGMEELLILAGNGCGPGAMKISRGMFESAVTAEYLRRNPLEADDFMEFQHILNWRHYGELAKSVAEGIIERCALREPKHLEEPHNRVAGQFPDKKVKIRKQWSQKTIFQMAEDIGWREEYQSIYGIGASIHRANVEAAFAYAGENDLESPPSLSWVSEALTAGYICLRQALDTLNACCELGFEQEIKSCLTDLGRVLAARMGAVLD